MFGAFYFISLFYVFVFLIIDININIFLSLLLIYRKFIKNWRLHDTIPKQILIARLILHCLWKGNSLYHCVWTNLPFSTYIHVDWCWQQCWQFIIGWQTFDGVVVGCAVAWPRCTASRITRFHVEFSRLAQTHCSIVIFFGTKTEFWFLFFLKYFIMQ